MRNKWSETILENAIKLHETGLTFAEIAIIINKTEKAVRIKLGRLGLSQNIKNCHEKIICLTCGNTFDGLKKDSRKFCSSKCAATHNNKLRTRKIKTESKNDGKNKVSRDRYFNLKNKHCLNCNNLVYDKFCDNTCRAEYKLKLIFDKIKSNEPIKIGDDSTNHRYYKKYLIKTYGEKCMECGWNQKNQITGKVPIELEHVDGNSENNKLENLKLLCPNCHSLTPTYKALNKGNGRYNRRERYKNGKSF